MVDLANVVPKNLLKNLSEIIESLEQGADIRVSLSRLVPIAFGFRSLMDLSDDQKVRLMSYLVMNQLGNVQRAYDGRTSDWYKLNSANVTDLKRILLDYCKAISGSIVSSDYPKFIEATEIFVSAFHPLARSTTMDVRETL